MSVARSKLLLAAGLLGVLLLAACGNGATPRGNSTASRPRTVAIKTLDTLRFDPASLTVKMGETIRFVVSNPGKADHEFVLGVQSVQDAEEQRMKQNMNMATQTPMGAMAALVVAAGETKEATVTFDQRGTVLYGCHMAGHYAGGMVGTVTVI